jgi:predicted ArsR family transcriptional regulator
MEDKFLKLFGWISDMLKRPTSLFFEPDSKEYEIVENFKEGWAKRDTIELLLELENKYGDKAGATLEKLLALNIQMDWPEVGKKEAHDGTEIEDFIRVLWEPLKENGFDYTVTKQNGSTTFCVTKCPVHELAKKTGMHKWLYHLACATDFYSTPAFCPKIGFNRTKTLMEGHDCCDHEYYYRY